MYIFILIIIIVLLICFIYYQFNYKSFNTIDIFNDLFNKYCTEPPIFDPKTFTWTQTFRDNYQIIKNEYIQYSKLYNTPLNKELNTFVGRCDIDNKWRTLYLRAFTKDTNLIKYFPKTMELINKIPNNSCTLAFFSILEPGAKLSPHIGIYKGVIRYHLGLKVPKEIFKCFINIEGNNLFWQEGQDIMFDDMFTHYVENNTNEERIILFLDIKRDFKNPLLNLLNTILLYIFKSNDVLNDTLNNINNYST